jgi:hypothetical protein
VENHHLQERIGSGKESSHDSLQELLALLVTVFSVKLEVQLGKKSSSFLLLEVHDGREDLEDGVKNELVESSLKGLALVGALRGPLLCVGVEVVVALELLLAT